MSGRDWAWMLAVWMGFCAFSNCMAAHVAKVERDHATQLFQEERETRRRCGADLEWCKVTAKGTCDFVADHLRGGGEGRPGR